MYTYLQEVSRGAESTLVPNNCGTQYPPWRAGYHFHSHHTHSVQEPLKGAPRLSFLRKKVSIHEVNLSLTSGGNTPPAPPKFPKRPPLLTPFSPLLPLLNMFQLLKLADGPHSELGCLLMLGITAGNKYGQHRSKATPPTE